MRSYITHRVFALVAMVSLTLFGFLLYPEEPTQRWYVLLFATVIFGYSHFIVGGFYQLKAFNRSPERTRLFSLFGLLALASLLVCVPFYLTGSTGLLAFSVITYFMVHGYFNEITLYEKQTKERSNHRTIFALVSGLLGLALLSVGHQSWFFSADLVFSVPPQSFIDSYTATNFISRAAQALGLLCLLAALVAQGFAARRARSRRVFHVIFFVVVLVAASIAWFWHPLHYIFILSSLLLYHFLIWFLFYFKVFKEHQPERLGAYLRIHVCILAPFLLLLVPNPLGELVQTYLLNQYTFLTATVIHISTSFLNESWVKRLLGIA